MNVTYYGWPIIIGKELEFSYRRRIYHQMETIERLNNSFFIALLRLSDVSCTIYMCAVLINSAKVIKNAYFLFYSIPTVFLFDSWNLTALDYYSKFLRTVNPKTLHLDVEHIISQVSPDCMPTMPVISFHSIYIIEFN